MLLWHIAHHVRVMLTVLTYAGLALAALGLLALFTASFVL